MRELPPHRYKGRVGLYEHGITDELRELIIMALAQWNLGKSDRIGNSHYANPVCTRYAQGHDIEEV